MKTSFSKTLPMAYGFIGAAAFWALAHSGPAIAQVGGSLPAFLRLQPSTPGTQQTGHANISGTATLGGIKMATGAGNGKILTSDASGVATWQNSAGLVLPYSGTSGSGLTPSFTVLNNDNGDAIRATATGVDAAGVVGSGFARGGRFSATGAPIGLPIVGVSGEANNGASSISIGGLFSAAGDNPIGVRGEVFSNNNLALGGDFFTVAGTGVRGNGFLGGKFIGTDTGLEGHGPTGGSFSGIYTGLVANAVSVSSIGIIASGNLGIEATGVEVGGTFAGQSKGVYGYSSGNTGTTYGGYFENTSVQGAGVKGRGLNLGTGVTGEGAIGVDGTSSLSGGIGVRGNSSIASGTSTGVYGISSSDIGVGVYGIAPAVAGNNTGVLGKSSSTSGAGVSGSATATSGTTFGGNFLAASASGYGVYSANSATSGGALAGYFTSTSVDARALYGLATSSTGVTYGTLGQSNSTSGGYGVWGLANATTGWSVWAQGRSGASGTKSFCIDHPLDPENKYLLHYSTESPTPQNFYSGNVTTGADGKAWVELPAYFAEVNKNFKYQLTVVDDTEGSSFVQAKVGRKIQGNRFLVMTSAPRVEVSWRVEADRNDRWVQRYGAPAQQDKDEFSRGTYLQPELYGQPKEKGLFEARLRSNGSSKP